MAENYEPTKREIYSEMLRMAREMFSVERIPEFGRSLKENCCSFAATFSFVNAIPYILPTFISSICSKKGDLEVSVSDFVKKNAGSSVGIVAGAGTLVVGQTLLYKHMYESGHPEILALPVAINVLSLFSVLESKARNRLIEQQSDLESQVQE